MNIQKKMAQAAAGLDFMELQRPTMSYIYGRIASMGTA